MDLIVSSRGKQYKTVDDVYVVVQYACTCVVIYYVSKLYCSIPKCLLQISDAKGAETNNWIY